MSNPAIFLRRSAAAGMDLIADPVVAISWPLERTRTRSRSCKWQAQATVDGQDYSASSWTGASNALARELERAGLSDRPLEIRDRAGRLVIRYRSFYQAARWTYTEGNHQLRRTLFKTFPSKIAPVVQAIEGNWHEANGAGVTRASPSVAGEVIAALRRQSSINRAGREQLFDTKARSTAQGPKHEQ